MKFTIDKHEKYVLIKINEKKIGHDLTPKLKTEFIIINAQGQFNIILDLSLVKEIEESIIGSLLVADRLCQNAGGLFIIVGESETLSYLLNIAQLQKSFITTSRVEEAIDLIFIEEIEKELNHIKD